MARTDCSLIQGFIDPNFARPDGDNSACIIIYGYRPSLALCILALVLFFIALCAHTWLLFRYRTWYFSTIVIGLCMEIIGYVGRTLSSQKNPYSVTFFVIQYFFIITAPVMFSAGIYTILSVAVTQIGAGFSPLRPRIILWLFITCDVVATVVQVLGAALIGSAYSNGNDATTPNHILLAGLAFQVFAFAVFIVCCAVFLWNVWDHIALKFGQFATAIGVATLAIYLRTCFRLAETTEGLMKSLSTHEVYFGILEFTPVMIAVYLLVFYHPGRFLNDIAANEDESQPDEKEEIKV